MGGFDHSWWGGYGPGFHFSWLWPLFIVFWFSFGHRARAHGRARQRSLRPDDPTGPLLLAAPDPALATLRERFARGEINRAEYEASKAALLSRPATSQATVPPPSAPPDTRPEWPDLT